MKCKYCGAPLDLSLDTCLYCRNKITFDNKFSKKERYIRIVLACVVFLVGIISIFILISLYLSPSEKIKLAFENFNYLENIKFNISTSIEDSEKNVRNIKSTILYTNSNDSKNLKINVESSKYGNNIEMYSIIDDNETSIYVKSNIIDIFGKTKSENEKWLVNVSNAFSISLFDNSDRFSYKYVENDRKKFEKILSNNELDKFKTEIKNLKLDTFKILDEELDIESINKLIVSVYVDKQDEIDSVEFVMNTSDNKKIVTKIQLYKLNEDVSVPIEAMSTIDKLDAYIENNKL